MTIEYKETETVHSPRLKILILIQKQLQLVFIHLINLTSNILGNDFLSCTLRRYLISLLGVQLGSRTIVRGGSYIYGGKLTTGKNCQINRSCYFDFTEKIVLGNNVVVGHGATFITAKHDIGNATQRASAVLGYSIVIEDGVWIGANTTLLPGITVGKGAIVAAGAVVTKNVPPNTVVAGIPAKVIREMSCE
jgi:maltose O-acetyltransferase